MSLYRLLFAVVIAVTLSSAPESQAEESKAAAEKMGVRTLVVHGISMYGDIKYPPNFTHFDYANPEAPKGGTFVNGVMGSFDSLNPFILKGNPAAGVINMFDSLLAPSKDESYSFYGLAAESVEVPEDRSWVAFTLRKEARWHDGSPITADDVVFSFTTLKTKGHPSYRALYRDVLKAEKLADNKVKFTFANSNNRELPILAGQLPILSKAYYKTHDFEKSGLDIPMASGPYTVEHIDNGRSITYKRVENYWAQDLPVNKGQNNFDRVRYDYYRDDNVLIEALKAGKIDFRQESIAKTWATAYNFPARAEGLVIKEEIKHTIPSGMQAFILNSRRVKFQDVRVRKALNYAFDFEWENKNLFYGAYTRINSYFMNSEYAAKGLPTKEEIALLTPFKEQLPPEVFTAEYKNPVTDGTGSGVRQNLIAAKKLLEEAGWVLKDGSLTNSKTGEVLAIEFLIDRATFERVIAPFVTNLKRLGIHASIRFIDSAQYIKRVESFDYDCIVETFAQSSAPPGNEQINYWYSSRADIAGSRNLIGVKSSVVDSLVEKVISAGSKEELLTATHALDRVLLWNYYVVPNWFSQSFRIIYWNKFSRPAVTPKYDLGLDSWWVDKEKQEKINQALRKE